MKLKATIFASMLLLGSMLLADIGGITMLPNPAQNQVTITWNANTSYKIEIYSLLGQRVYEQKQAVSNTSIDVQSLQNGIYLVRISDGENQLVKRLKINH